jgi:predicted phage terminase large subunit-like protein
MTTTQTTQTPSQSQFKKSPGFVSVIKAEEWWVEQARKSIVHYMTYVSDGQRKPANHHLTWLQAILDPKIKRLLIIAPRESAKTSLAVDVMSYWVGHFPHSTNGIFSVSVEQAKDRLDSLKQIIELPRYKNVFPHIHADFERPYNKSEFSVWSEKWPGSQNIIGYQAYRSLIASYGSMKNPTVFSAGMSSSGIIGRRFSGIALVDDPHDSKNSATLEQCLKVEKFFGDNILGAMQETGKVVVITTRWAELDLAGRLSQIKRSDGSYVWHTIDIPAIDRETNSVSYWPEYWSIERLQEKREEVGDIMFETMYLNNPLGASTGMFQPQHLIKDVPEGVEFERIVVSCDMAKAKTASADFTVAFAIAKDKNKPFNYYVLDGIRGKWDFDEGISEIAKFAGQVFERYDQLNGVVFEEPFDTDRANVMRDRYPSLPVMTVKPKGDKAQRLSNVAVKAQAGKLYINQELSFLPAVRSELLGFPKAAHDDTCDAMSLPLQLEMWSTNYMSGLKEIRSPHLLF